MSLMATSHVIGCGDGLRHWNLGKSCSLDWLKDLEIPLSHWSSWFAISILACPTRQRPPPNPRPVELDSGRAATEPASWEMTAPKMIDDDREPLLIPQGAPLPGASSLPSSIPPSHHPRIPPLMRAALPRVRDHASVAPGQFEQHPSAVHDRRRCAHQLARQSRGRGRTISHALSAALRSTVARSPTPT